MEFSLTHLNKKDWERLSESAHLISFRQEGRDRLDRIDFAILVTDGSNQPCGYFTFYEHDAETLYMQHGGAFPNAEKSLLVFKGYAAVVSQLLVKYKRLITKIENTNFPMLKLAMKVGFRVTGISVFKNKILLENLLEAGEKKI